MKTFLASLSAICLAGAANAWNFKNGGGTVTEVVTTPVVSMPEAGITGSLAAFAAVAAVGAMAWERRRRNRAE